MLSKIRETEITVNQEECACFGSLALDEPKRGMKENETPEHSGKNSITYTEAATQDKPEDPDKPEDQEYQCTGTSQRPAVLENRNTSDHQSYRIRPERNVYIPVTSGNVNNSREEAIRTGGINSAPGLIYEVAEELYIREKAVSELEALCQPPFHKVFDRQQLSRLDHRAGERTSSIISAAAERGRPDQAPTAEPKPRKQLTTAAFFLLQFLLMLPVINLIAAMCYSFRRNSDPGKKAFCRAYLIWLTIFLSAALVFFSFCFFNKNFEPLRFLGLDH